jgi:hypothetical protein
MQWEHRLDTTKLARWLSLGANIGVLAGIILLVVELDQNRGMMRAQIRHELAMGIVDLLQTPASDAQLSGVLYRAHAGEELTAAEQFQFELRTNALFRYWEDVHYQYRAGLYDEVEFARQREAWRVSISNSVRGREYWCRVRTLYSPEFMGELDSLLVDNAC